MNSIIVFVILYVSLVMMSFAYTEDDRDGSWVWFFMCVLSGVSLFICEYYSKI